MNTKCPFMVEFTGSPEAGKTTCIKALVERFKNEGLKVHYIRESAEIISSETNIPKTSFEATCAMRLLAVIKIMEAKYEDYDLLLIDRGLLDGIFFPVVDDSEMPESKNSMSIFLNSLKPHINPDLLVVLKVDPDVSIARKGHEGTIVTRKFVKAYNNSLDSFVNSMSSQYFLVDTTNYSKEQVIDIVYNEITERIEKTRRT